MKEVYSGQCITSNGICLRLLELHVGKDLRSITKQELKE